MAGGIPVAAPQFRAMTRKVRASKLELAQLNIGWCTPGVHGPGVTGGNRRQRDAGFTLRTVVHA